MRSALLVFLLLGAGCPRSGTGPARPEPLALAPQTVPSDHSALGGTLRGPVSAEEAAERLVEVQAEPGRAVVIIHCSFPEAWVAAVPLELADSTDVDLVRSVVLLGADPNTTTHVPHRERLEPYAAVACAPDGVLQVMPGSWQLVAGRRDRLRTREGTAAAWLEVVQLAAGDRLEYHLDSNDLTLDVPAR